MVSEMTKTDSTTQPTARQTTTIAPYTRQPEMTGASYAKERANT